MEAGKAGSGALVNKVTASPRCRASPARGSRRVTVSPSAASARRCPSRLNPRPRGPRRTRDVPGAHAGRQRRRGQKPALSSFHDGLQLRRGIMAPPARRGDRRGHKRAHIARQPGWQPAGSRSRRPTALRPPFVFRSGEHRRFARAGWYHNFPNMGYPKYNAYTDNCPRIWDGQAVTIPVIIRR